MIYTGDLETRELTYELISGSERSKFTEVRKFQKVEKLDRNWTELIQETIKSIYSVCYRAYTDPLFESWHFLLKISIY